MRVFLNGQLFERSDARLSAFDAGTQHGVGLFETLIAHHNPNPIVDDDLPVVIPHLAEHMQRLVASAKALGLSDDLRSAALGDAVLYTAVETLNDRRTNAPEAAGSPVRLRLTVTGGDLNMLQRARNTEGNRPGQPANQPTVMVDAQPATAYPAAMFERGVAITIADARANPLDPTAGHKTLNYWWRLRELQSAAAKGAGEALVLQVSNHLCGGCVSNIILVKDGALITPIAQGEEANVGGRGAIPSPVLPGITRGAVLNWADERGMDIRRAMLSVDDLLDADEVFLTNSSWGVLPVVRVERETVGDGEVGEVTRQVRAALLTAISTHDHE